MKLLLATGNPGKIKEYKSLLDDTLFEILTLADIGLNDGPEESEESFAENARLKSVYWAEKSGLLTLADDSGLEVSALGGVPGVRSARYGGTGLTDQGRVSLLLKEMADTPWEERQARFVCVIVVASPDGPAYLFEGECDGLISFEPRGENGFGYDPVFYLPELDKTFAELPSSLKNTYSHRAKAARKAREFLIKLLEKGR